MLDRNIKIDNVNIANIDKIYDILLNALDVMMKYVFLVLQNLVNQIKVSQNNSQQTKY